jgi:predicted peptidase
MIKRTAVCSILLILFMANDMIVQHSAAQDASAKDAPSQLTPPPAPEAVFEAREFKSSDGGGLPYRLLKPLDYVDQGDSSRRYPLVLFLHGAGERGAENVRQLTHGGKNFADEGLRQRHPAFVVAPQCPAEQKWVEVDWSAGSQSMPAVPGETMHHVFELIAALQKEFPIDDQRIYAVGLSMGGYGVWDILERRPELLAAGIPICGGGDPARAAAFKATPVWVFHGGADSVVPVKRSREMVKALQDAGGRPVYTEYEGVDHDSWTQTFDNRLVWDWLFAQHK